MKDNRLLKPIKQKKKEKTAHREVFKTVFSALVVTVCFFVMYYVVSSYASPNKFTAAGQIPQTYTILESEGGTYFGPVIDYVYSGAGEFQYLAGGTYEGDFDESKREGNGTFTWENGDTFFGQWKDDDMLNGTYTFADGRTFTGTFVNNKFDNGQFTVQSIPKELSLESFSATYAAGHIQQVQFAMTNGASYSGYLTGKADIVYPSGNVYSGNVVNGQRSGSGKFIWIEKGRTKTFYEGNWNNGLMSGEGTYYYSADLYPSIKGTFTNGVLNGTATYSKEAGNTFSTTWENGVCRSIEET